MKNRSRVEGDQLHFRVSVLRLRSRLLQNGGGGDTDSVVIRVVVVGGFEDGDGAHCGLAGGEAGGGVRAEAIGGSFQVGGGRAAGCRRLRVTAYPAMTDVRLALVKDSAPATSAAAKKGAVPLLAA